MTFIDLAQNYFALIWNAFQADVSAFSHWWMYAFLLIPALGYSFFFVLKWTFLTAPIWIPINMIFGGLLKRAYDMTIVKIIRKRNKKVE